MRIVFLGCWDWANECNRIARALTASGRFDARCIVAYPHPFRYEEDVIISHGGEAAAQELIEDADWIVSTGDGDYDFLRQWLAAVSNNARRASMHVGQAYRDNPRLYDTLDSDLGFSTRVFCPDLLRLVQRGDRTGLYLIPPGPTVIRPPERKDGEPLRVIHTPSSPERKGTPFIAAAMKGIPGVDFRLVTGRPYQDAAAARSGCHAFIDQYAPDAGAFGGAVTEAASQGLAIVTNTEKVTPEVRAWVMDRFGVPMPPTLEIRSAEGLRGHIEHLRDDPVFCRAMQKEALEWARDYLSPSATADLWTRNLS